MRAILLALALTALFAAPPASATSTQALVYAGVPGAANVCPAGFDGDSVCFSPGGATSADVVVRDASGVVPSFDVITYANFNVEQFRQNNFCGTASALNMVGVTKLVIHVHDGSSLCIRGGLPTIGTVTASFS